MRKQVQISFYQIDLQSGTRLVNHFSSKSSIFSIFLMETEIQFDAQ